MSFTVEPDVLRRVGNDMRTLAESVAHAERYVDQYVQVEHHNGTVLAAIGEQVNKLQGWMLFDYGSVGDARWAYRGFGDALHGLAHDYQTTDRAQAARYDGLMDEVALDNAEAPTTLQAPTIRLQDCTKRFTVAPEEGFPEIDVYNDFARGVDYIVGFKWVGQFLSASGITDPFQQFKKELEGDWKQVGRAVGALKALSRYWDEMEHTTRAIPNNFDGAWVGNRFRNQVEGGVTSSWTGHAASAATQHLRSLASKAGDHYFALDDKANSITLQMMAANDLLDQLMGIIEAVLAIMPDGSKLDDYVADFLSPKKAGERVLKLFQLVARFLTTFRLLIDNLGLVVAVFSELSSLGGVNFPQVKYTAPDVNGA